MSVLVYTKRPGPWNLEAKQDPSKHHHHQHDQKKRLLGQNGKKLFGTWGRPDDLPMLNLRQRLRLIASNQFISKRNNQLDQNVPGGGSFSPVTDGSLLIDLTINRRV